jgi:hypothetical protein
MCAVLLMCEAVDDHDARIVGVGEACRVDDAMRSWWNADLVCSETPAIVVGDQPRGWERWLLFDDSAFAFDFGRFTSTRRGELAGLHELANVSAAY